MSPAERAGKRVPIIREMAMRGLKASEIAAQTGYDRDYVRSTMKRLRANGEPIPIHNMRHGLSAPPAKYLEPDVLMAFHAEAVRRGVQAAHLIEDLLTTIARDNLFAAVLDDE